MSRSSGRHGYRPYTQSFDVTSSDAGTLTIPALEDVPTSTGGGGSVIVDTPPPRSRVILAASLAGGGLALCIISPLWANKVKSDYDEAVKNLMMPDYSAARTKQHIATGMFVAGVGLIGVGAYLYFTKPSATATAIAPVVDAHTVGIAISGSL